LPGLVVEMAVVLAVTWQDVVVARYIYKQSLMSKRYAERNKKTYPGSRRVASRALPPAAAALHWPTLVFVGLRWGCVGLSCVSRRWPGLAVLVVERAVVLAVTWQDVVVGRYIYN
jgi:hypothetical protein